MSKRETAKTSSKEETSGDSGNKNRSHKMPSISVETTHTEKDSTLVSSTSELAKATQSPIKQDLLKVKRKRRSKSPVPKTKTLEFIDWKNLSPRRSNAEDCIFDDIPPNIDSLMEAYQKNYHRRLMEKMLDYRVIIKEHLFLEDKYGRKEKILLSDLLKQKLDNGDERQKTMLIIRNFLVGLQLLKYSYDGELESGTKSIKEAANERLPQAMYTFAIITFAKVVQCCYSNKKNSNNSKKSKLPEKKEVEDAVRYMTNTDVRLRFFPLPNFVLGMILLYKVDYLAKLIEKIEPTECTIWCKYFYDILKTGMSNKEESETFGVKFNNYEIAHRKLGLFKWHQRLNLPKYMNNLKYVDVLNDKEGKVLKWIIQTIKLELAKEALENDLSLAKYLLKELSSQSFVESHYISALALLKNQFRDGEMFKSDNFNEALNLLDSAVTHGHREAMLLFGTLPFRKEFDLVEKDNRKNKGWICIDSLINYVMSDNNEDFRKEAAKLCASEYLKRDGYLTYDEEKAKAILTKSGCFDELTEMERKLLARKKAATDALPELLKELQDIRSKWEKCVLPENVLRLLDLLIGALSSQFHIEKSRKVLLQLELIHIECADMETSTIERRLINSIHLVHEVLRAQIDQQPNSIQKEGGVQITISVDVKVFRRFAILNYVAVESQAVKNLLKLHRRTLFRSDPSDFVQIEQKLQKQLI